MEYKINFKIVVNQSKYIKKIIKIINNLMGYSSDF